MSSLILTARIDSENQVFFDKMRQQHFPKEINLLNAHLTLFHKLPDAPATYEILEQVVEKPFEATISEIKSIGRGVAYFLSSPELLQIRSSLKHKFQTQLSLQDQQGYRPHITIQNKVKPEDAKQLLQEIASSFEPFKIVIEGLDLWYYLDGPWKHARHLPFYS
ncbi:MAG: 2'-5' RNA ligase family protein [Sphingobacteriales bacterium]|nr:MAG: 2'-5' RNA ligase family protein [Sphingobacteriales bacterium]